MILEMATPGFVLFFFGVAAVLMSLATLAFPHLPLFAQAVLFSVLSFIGLFFFRNALSEVFAGKKIGRDDVVESNFIGKTVLVVERITPQLPGKVELNGTHWRACSNATLEPGAVATVTAQENLTLTVMAKE
jgi:membrane protein implicated in regulation of membrane protease activity